MTMRPELIDELLFIVLPLNLLPGFPNDPKLLPQILDRLFHISKMIFIAFPACHALNAPVCKNKEGNDDRWISGSQ